MHGAILYTLGKYISERHGVLTWKKINVAAGIDDPYFVPTQEYPDAQALALLRAATQIAGESPEELLESFGTFLVPALLGLYGALVKPEWGTLDLIEQTEATVHRVVRMQNPGAEPPRLMTKRTGPNEVTVFYKSPRRMCHLAVGIIHGVARHYGDRVSTEQTVCMHKASDHCEIVVRLLSGPEKLS